MPHMLVLRENVCLTNLCSAKKIFARQIVLRGKMFAGQICVARKNVCRTNLFLMVGIQILKVCQAMGNAVTDIFGMHININTSINRKTLIIY